MTRPAEDYIARSRERLAGYDPRRLDRPDAMPSAVLVPLIHHGGADRVILTVRSHDVEHHKGQISFPGGAVHAADADLAATALRETWEEIGVRPEDVELLGQLDDIVTISNFVVAPFVGVIGHGPYEFVPSPIEVAEVIEPPLAHLLDPATLVWEAREGEAGASRHPALWYEGHRIWGATARMLYGFLQLLREPPAR
ncbi:MAG TPA: CoA pyrophosphatase [Dehalococcoidia bacterium]|nr:CoA pyrophosphatase [Dehalococcoidia bacterium]